LALYGVSPELRMSTHRGEGTWDTHSLARPGDLFPGFLGSGAVVFWGFCVRCGRAKVVSSSFVSA